ncbi:MAG: hypothetical protein KGS48_02885 [Bacteroidetes bacterium]|nr:hypothetical protein [Bacteroidota bacterium]
MTRIFALILLLGAAQLQAQTEKAPLPKTAGYFDPARQPIGRQQSDGSFLLTVSEAALSRSLKQVIPDVGIIQKVVKQKIREQEFLVFESRRPDSLAHVLYIAIPIRRTRDGQVFADAGYQTCSGAPCSNCKFSADGCVCEEQAPADNPTQIGRCNHSISTQPALARVPDNKD